MTLEDFAVRCLYLECGRLHQYLSEYESRKLLRRTIARVKRGQIGLTPRTQWTAMVENWYQLELSK